MQLTDLIFGSDASNHLQAYSVALSQVYTGIDMDLYIWRFQRVILEVSTLKLCNTDDE
jgi:hypothetical protein